MSLGLQELNDYVELRKLVEAYADRCDRRDPEGVASTFTEDGRLARYKDEDAQTDAVTDSRGRPKIAELVGNSLRRYAVTTHFLGQQSVDLDGDRGTGETYCLAHHHYVHNGEWFDRVMSIRYHDAYLRTESGWLIEDRRLAVDWIEYRPVGSPTMAPPGAAEGDAFAARPLP